MAPKRGTKSTLAPFLTKLRNLVDTVPANAASWSRDGNSFIIHNSDQFEKNLSKHFKGTLATFTRQLHFYAFSKVQKNGHEWSFHHEKFRRDYPQLIYEIKRKTRTDNGDGVASQLEVKVLRDQVSLLQDRLVNMSKQFEHVQQELTSMRTQDRKRAAENSIFPPPGVSSVDLSRVKRQRVDTTTPSPVLQAPVGSRGVPQSPLPPVETRSITQWSAIPQSMAALERLMSFDRGGTQSGIPLERGVSQNSMSSFPPLDGGSNIGVSVPATSTTAISSSSSSSSRRGVPPGVASIRRQTTLDLLPLVDSFSTSSAWGGLKSNTPTPPPKTRVHVGNNNDNDDDEDDEDDVVDDATLLEKLRASPQEAQLLLGPTTSLGSTTSAHSTHSTQSYGSTASAATSDGIYAAYSGSRGADTYAAYSGNGRGGNGNMGSELRVGNQVLRLPSDVELPKGVAPEIMSRVLGSFLTIATACAESMAVPERNQKTADKEGNSSEAESAAALALDLARSTSAPPPAGGGDGVTTQVKSEFNVAVKHMYRMLEMQMKQTSPAAGASAGASSSSVSR